MPDYGYFSDYTCLSCKRQYKKESSREFLTKLGIKDYPPEVLNVCPVCLADAYLKSIDINNTTPTGSTRAPVSGGTPAYQNTNTAPSADLNLQVNVPEVKGITKTLALIFASISVLILIYSLVQKYLPQVPLPEFPFYPYIVGFSVLVFFIKFNQGMDFLFLIFIAGNFFAPQFRNLFYSYFESTWTKILFTLLFVNSFVSLSNLFFVYFRSLYLPKWGTVRQGTLLSATYKALIPTMFFYFAVISPFFLGAIKPKGDKTVKVDKVQIEPIFDALSTLTRETVDVEVARQYFLDGKDMASRGTIEDLTKSVDFYKKALELVPKFSTAYAEMAYSYASIYRIEKSTDRKSTASIANLQNAWASLDGAKLQNNQNYTIYAIESIVDYISGNKKAAKASLDKAISLSAESGANERLLQAMAYNSKSDIQSLNYLITIRDKISPNSAELSNLLSVKYYKVGNLEKTKESAERAILLNPKFDEPYLNLTLVTKKRADMGKLYDKVIEMKSDYASTGEYLKRMINWQFGMKITFFVLFFFMIIQFFYHSVQLTQGKEPPEKLGLFLIKSILLFTVIFGSFELYIHAINPVNSLTHLFPTSFPIF